MKELILVIYNTVLKDLNQKEQVTKKLQQLEIISIKKNIKTKEYETLTIPNRDGQEDTVNRREKYVKIMEKIRKGLYINEQEKSSQFLHYLNWVKENKRVKIGRRERTPTG